MKKLLINLSLSLPIFLPCVLISCSQNNNEARIKEAKDKINQITSSKPKPTLTTPPGNLINLTSYLNPKLYTAPQTNIEGVKIEIENIEIPTPNSKTLIIWLKATSTNTLDISPDISGFYFINFNEIDGVVANTIQPVTTLELQEPFENLLNPKRGLINKFINDAINGAGAFEGQSTIDPSTLIDDPKGLNDRLTTSKINSNIFEDHQANVYMEFTNFDKSTNKIYISVQLRGTDLSNVVSYQMEFDFNKTGARL